MYKSRLLSWLKNLNNFEIVFLLFLIVSQVYYFYRWAFQLGSNFSPPNYQLTPSYLQYGKYLIALAFFVWLAVYLFRRFSILKIILTFFEQRFWLLVSVLVVYQGVSLLKFGLNPSSFGVSQTVKMLFVVPFALFIPFLWKDKKPFDLLKIFLVFSVTYQVVYEFVVVGAYVLFKRLPGLAFSNLLPRFGGGWDDPNSFAAFMILVILVMMVIQVPKSTLGKWVFYFGLLIFGLMFFSAYSFTGFIGLTGSLIILLLCRKLNFAKLSMLILATIIFFGALYVTHYLQLLYVAKVSSSAGHLATPVAVKSLVPPVVEKFSEPIIGPISGARFHENIYLQTYLNYGLVGLILLCATELLSIYRAFTGWLFTQENDNETKNFFLVAFIFLGAFAVMNIGIPLFQVFPVNLFVWVLMASVWVLPQTNYDRDKSPLFNKLGKVTKAFLKGV